MGEEKRENLMESLFGEESDDDADAAAASSYSEQEEEEEGQGEADGGGDREESEGEREASEGEGDKEESEHERVSRRSSDDGGGEEGSGSENDAQGQGHEREATTRSEEVEDDEQRGAARIRAALGDSDDEDQEEGGVDGPRKATSREGGGGEGSDLEGSYRKDGKRAMEEDEEERYDSDEERVEVKKPKGEPLTLEVPLRQPPTQAHNMNLVRVSNIMDIEQRLFDPKTYVEEDGFCEEGGPRRLRIEENVVRWRYVKNRDGSHSPESNARFVKWSDGSMQLLIGNEVLDLSVQDGQQEESHLFIRHPKGLLQAQGKLARKMRFMPSSLTSKSHRLLTALVDSTHKKVFKVKNMVTDFDPEKDKELKEKAAEQRIKSKEDLQRKQEKTMRKYPQARERDLQLSPGYLEGALEEEDEDYEDDGRTHRRYQEQLDAENRAERRINQVKRQTPRAAERRPPSRNRREALEDDVSEDSDGNRGDRGDEGEDDQERDDVEEEEEEEEDDARDSRRKRKDRDREQQHQQQHYSPPRKQQAHRRRAVVSDSDED